MPYHSININFNMEELLPWLIMIDDVTSWFIMLRVMINDVSVLWR